MQCPWIVTANPKQTVRYSRGLDVLGKSMDGLGSLDSLDRSGVCINFIGDAQIATHVTIFTLGILLYTPL